ncbi:MAG: hypothetical protein ACREHG_10585 [Candidatus Saccharimonadales bacterium]
MTGTTDSQDLNAIYGYPVPDTWASEQTITADWLNRNVRDSQIFLAYSPICIVTREADQSIANSTVVDVIYDTELIDTDGMFVAPSSDITIQRPGIYSIQHTAAFAANATNLRATHIAINGVEIAATGGTASTTSVTSQSCSAIAALNEGDVVSNNVFQVSGAALNIVAETRLSLRLISTSALDLTFDPTTGNGSSSTPTPPKSKPPTAPAPTKHTAAFGATYSRTYDGDNSTTWDDSSYAYQGRYDSNRNNTKSLIGFNFGSIESTLAGATKITGTFTFKVAHSYYNSGLTAVIGSHDYASKPSSWSLSHVYQNQIRRSSCVAGRTYTVNLTPWQCWAFQQGVITGMAFGPGPSTSLTYYGFMYGASVAPASLHFTYYS